MKLFKPYVSWRAVWYAVKVLLSDQLAEGPVVKQFEHEFGQRFGLTNVVAVNSGTSALELAYELADIREGDEVITPVLTCTATNIPLLRRNCTIVFADIDKDLNMNIQDVKNKITPKTKAIVFVHLGGNNRGLEELQRICESHSIILIEDAAQAVGSGYWGKGEFTAVSLQAIKTLTSGDGGFLICKRAEDFRKAKKLRWFGYDRERKQKEGDVDLTLAGYKYHMNDISAAIGLGNLRSLDKVLEKRKILRDYYNTLPGVKCYTWLCFDHRMGGEQHHYRNDKYTIFKKFKNDCPNMDRKEKNWRLLPYHHGITINQAKEFYESNGK